MSKPLLLGEPIQRRKPTVIIGGSVLIVALAVVIPVAILRSIAATGQVGSEPENGTVSTAASVGSSTLASGGQFVQFGPGVAGAGQARTLPIGWVDTQDQALLDSTNGYNSLELDITPEVVQGTDGYYFANSFYFTKDPDPAGGGYAGFQTNGNNGTTNIGHMAIFSIWNSTSGTAEPGGWGVPFSGEGSGYSVRLAYNWVAGRTYRLRMYLDTAGPVGGNSVWAASLTDMTSGVVTRIGRINAPTAWGKPYGPVSFHERYSGSIASCAAINHSQVLFSNSTANQGAIKGGDFNHYVIANTNDCPGLTWLQDVTDGYRSGVGTTKTTP